MNPHLYKVYAKVIDTAMHVLPAKDEFNGNEVFPGLYVGDVWAAYNLEQLKQRNITHVVTVVMGLEPPFPGDFKYLNVHVRDVEDETIFEHFEEVVKFIDEGRATGNVFLHCLRGVSRSGTIAAAYVIHQKRVPAEEAILFLREKRSIIDPNPGFIRQLNNYYKLITTVVEANPADSTVTASTTTTTTPADTITTTSTTSNTSTPTPTTTTTTTTPAATITTTSTTSNTSAPTTPTTTTTSITSTHSSLLPSSTPSHEITETDSVNSSISTPSHEIKSTSNSSEQTTTVHVAPETTLPESDTPPIEPFTTITHESLETSDATTTLVIKNE
eukprot:Phypoly_transcript_11846.p1 GENE.Phypoly_transcript_11846~~Phypoly_transcript_11846.p1  ORF type:complete len:382 (+),score=92.33 Phypoly_transcript_11846:158-1147(+)